MLEQRIQQHFIDSADLAYQVAPVLGKALEQAIQAVLACVTSGGKILACGAGASDALARRFAGYFVGRFERDRPELAALALRGDNVAPTADSDRPADRDVFARAVRALGQSGDLLLCISASGEAAAVCAAIEAAHEREMTVLAFTGGASAGAIGRSLRDTDVPIYVSAERAARVHEIHLLALHCLCDAVDGQLLGDQDSSS